MVINFFIIITFSFFHQDDPLIELNKAGEILEKSMGSFAMYIWALGLFSSGQSATMAGTITGQYIMDGFLNLQISKKTRVLISRGITLIPCLVISKFANIELVYILLNIIQFVQLPFVLIPLFKFIENEDIMNGYRYPKKKLLILKIVSVGFTLMNIFQILFNISLTVRFIIIFILFMAIYIWALLKLLMFKIVYKRVQLIEFDVISSLGC